MWLYFPGVSYRSFWHNGNTAHVIDTKLGQYICPYFGFFGRNLSGLAKKRLAARGLEARARRLAKYKDIFVKETCPKEG